MVGALLDLESGRTLAVESAPNRQAASGTDVIARAAFAMAAEPNLERLRGEAVATLDEILTALCERAGIGRESVYEAVAVGNPTMLHLLLGVDPAPIARAPFVPAFRGPLDCAAREVGIQIHPEGRLATLPLLGAYVGADALAGLLATDLARDERLRLFIDLGTNSEIALGSRRRVVATSAPAGPAFEGGRIRCGMWASAGAIERVRIGERLEIGTIGGGPPRGLCGSGLIDAAAELRRTGLLDAEGRLRGAAEAGSHPLAGRLQEIDRVRAFRLSGQVVLTQLDLRELQMARSAVATAVETLMVRLGISPADLDEILLAGAFGSAVEPARARTIGLVPPVPVERIRFVGNTALEGAKMALLSFRQRQLAAELASRVEYVELSALPDLNERFLANIDFPPLEAEP